MLPSARKLVLPPAEKEELLVWLTALTLKIPTNVGVAGRVQVRTTEQVSLDFLENSYALDVSEASWPRRGGGPVGEWRD